MRPMIPSAALVPRVGRRRVDSPSQALKDGRRTTPMGDYDNVRFDDNEGGLFGPAEIERFMRAEHERARRYKFPIVCCVAAIDRLDQLQDLYGVDAREEIVRTAIRAIRTVMRDSDLLARLAGDRVLVFYSHPAKGSGALLARRMLAAVKKQRFELDGRVLKVAASVGVSRNDDGASESFDALVAAAEEGLRAAQRGGGDRHVEIDQHRAAEERRRRLDAAPAPRPSAAAALPDELLERDLKIELLERRLAKLMSMLDVTEEELRRVQVAKQVDLGQPSIYRQVQGLSATETQQEKKRDMMRSIFEANLELRKQSKKPPEG